MVRVNLKGGVWKNSEDEILKAAVQKYGKQQWARVASLLNKKTAKQSKARWLEWLDPAIRKTEWSRAEDEKLLHLAKLLPAQWKTIAPLVGRTATQCQEHYEELLDQAATGGDAASANATLRQQTLRPGQIDSHPETKPARPDPIDMDEDEMEMLQEARARLANTQGKKAKRKQRERMLAQAKRLADLQKRRELKQAGLLSTKPGKKRKSRTEIDFGAEIPFYKPAPAGFHDTATEQSRSEAQRKKRQRDVDFQKVNENLYKTRDRAAAQAQKKEETRMRVLEDTNAKYGGKAEKLEQKSAKRPRGLLQLPDPTVTDTELAQLAKQHQGQPHEFGSSSTATQTLLRDYSDRPLPTPMRRPASTPSRDLMREASHLRMLEQGQTPLLTGGSTAQGDEEEDDDRKMAAVPVDRAGAGGTPAQDQLGLDDGASVGTFGTTQQSIREIARQERRAAKKARLELEAALAALPAPQFEYELAVPETGTDNDDETMMETVFLDQADVEAAQREEWRRQAQEEFRLRSSVLQRTDLPRPLSLYPPTEQDLISQEAWKLMQHDARAHPVPAEDSADNKKKKKRKQAEGVEEKHQMSRPPPVSLDNIPLAKLDLARSLVQQELEVLLEEKIAQVVRDGKATNRQDARDFLTEETLKVVKSNSESYVYKSGGWTVAKTDADRIESARLEFETLQEATTALRKKNDKLESKLSVVNGGYVKRAKGLREQMLEEFGNLQNARIEESVYSLLESHEVQGAMNRGERLKQETAALKKSEAVLQKRYGELLVERRRAAAISAKTGQ
jgi:pre-mRNA-splicing factor CDC5/CEF1